MGGVYVAVDDTSLMNGRKCRCDLSAQPECINGELASIPLDPLSEALTFQKLEDHVRPAIRHMPQLKHGY